MTQVKLLGDETGEGKLQRVYVKLRINVCWKAIDQPCNNNNNTQNAAVAPRASTTHPLVWAEQHKHTSGTCARLTSLTHPFTILPINPSNFPKIPSNNTCTCKNDKVLCCYRGTPSLETSLPADMAKRGFAGMYVANNSREGSLLHVIVCVCVCV